MFAVSVEGKYLYCGGIWDNSLRVYNLHKGKMLATVTAHSDIVTCVSLDNCGSYMVTGSKDCTCIVWSLPGNQVPANSNGNNIFTPVPVTTLYGHDAPISSVAIYTELDTVVSGSLVRFFKTGFKFVLKYLIFVFKLHRMELLMFTPCKISNLLER